MSPSFSSSNIVAQLPVLTASAILIVAVADDFRTRKFHNWLFLACLAVAAVEVFAVGGFAGFSVAILGFLAGIAIFFPLVMMKVVGAGDMKLMAAFGLAAGWDAVLQTSLYGLFWGAAFGVLATVFRGQARLLASNMVSIVTLRERKGLELHKIPFTVAILMGWMTVLTLRGLP